MKATLAFNSLRLYRVPNMPARAYFKYWSEDLVVWTNKLGLYRTNIVGKPGSTRIKRPAM